MKNQYREECESLYIEKVRQLCNEMDKDEAETLLSSIQSRSITDTSIARSYHEKLCFRDYTICTLFLTSGLRVSELVGINIDDIDFNKNCIGIIRKGNKEAYVYISDEMKEILNEYIDYRQHTLLKDSDEKALFLSTRGSRITVRSVEMIVKKYSKAYLPSKDIHTHSLRTSYAMELLKETHNIEVVAANLGHEDISTTQKHYSRSDEDMKKETRNLVSFQNK